MNRIRIDETKAADTLERLRAAVAIACNGDAVESRLARIRAVRHWRELGDIIGANAPAEEGEGVVVG